MEYRYFGNTGLRMSAIAFGTQTFGWNIDEKESKGLLEEYTQAGGNYLDTADSYNNGDSERILGSWIKDIGSRRDDLIVGTKVFFPTGEDVNNTGASRKHILHSVESSLKRLNTEYIDLLQIHCFDKRTPFEETLRTLDDLISAGKVRYLGASNYTPSDLMKNLMIARYTNKEAFVSLQLEYSLLVRSPEWELIPLCKREGVGMLAWSPLAGGWLSGKYRRGKDIPKNSRAGRKDRWDDQAEQRGSDQAYDIIDVLHEIAEEVGHSVSQVSINWVRQNPAGIIPLIGARTVSQLKENLDSLSWSLSDDQMKRLNEVSSIGKPSPYSFIERYTRE
ncbi:aldo/keto reductase [uncultured Sphaerochaeta sp.]|uniref:aldo/keto reductase n=1 Tax=uncultured Sphaerochaeta sp. TaxID=886478 RepID=UPI002A0A2D3E|nr:aldo/keto reductase [uncultured Sphaerochaeta sp.]